MQRRESWPFFIRPVLFIVFVWLVDYLQHYIGIEPCILTRLADSISSLTGISDQLCFALLVVVGAYLVFEFSRGIFGLVWSQRR